MAKWEGEPAFDGKRGKGGSPLGTNKSKGTPKLINTDGTNQPNDPEP